MQDSWLSAVPYPSGSTSSSPIELEYLQRKQNIMLVLACTKKKVVGLERGPLSLVSTTEELLDRKVAAPV
jgi:hypothetical protein